MQNNDQEPAIRVHDLGIFFPAERPALRTETTRLMSWATKRLGTAFKGQPALAFERKPAEGKWVFRNLTFDVRCGEVFGIVGGNGCGKTTLLKILSRVLYPSEGRAEIRGRVASLLAVGTGFNLAFTGRENIYLNGMILGLSRAEIDRKFNAIVDFAEIGDSLDEQVRNYSSGMRARLAFSVAAQLESDIVILDEVLSVGDAGFQQKSLGVIREMKRQGRTILLVSHNMSAIDNFCDRGMVIRDGQIAHIGEPTVVIRDYLDAFTMANREAIALRDRQDREGNGRLLITDYAFETASGLPVRVPRAGDDLTLMLDYEGSTSSPMKNVEIGLAIMTAEGSKLVRFSTESLGDHLPLIPPCGRFRLSIPRFPFAQGNYICGFRIVVAGEVADYIPNAIELDVGRGDFFGSGHVDEHSPVYLPHDWHIEAVTAEESEKAVVGAR